MTLASGAKTQRSYHSTTAEASKAIWNGPCVVMKVTMRNDSTTYLERWFMVLNSGSTPSDSTYPEQSKVCEAGKVCEIDFGPNGRYLSSGLAVASSSTALQLTTSGQSDGWFSADFYTAG